MIRTIKIDDKKGLKYTYDLRNHMWVYLRLVFLDKEGNIRQFSNENDNSKNFIFDTGAQNTIISYNRALECGYNNLPVIEKMTAGGFGGGYANCSRVEIPSILITDELIINKPSILLLDNSNVNVNILGQDILKYYSYYLDNKRQIIYFNGIN